MKERGHLSAAIVIKKLLTFEYTFFPVHEGIERSHLNAAFALPNVEIEFTNCFSS